MLLCCALSILSYFLLTSTKSFHCDRSFWCQGWWKSKNEYLFLFLWNEAVDVIEATEAVEVIEAKDILRPRKSLLSTPESSRLLNLALFDVLKTIIFSGIMKYHFSILATFLFEAVEASLCYFFENWGIKLKFQNILKPLGTMIQQTYWSFYPSKPSFFIHFNMINPVQ